MKNDFETHPDSTDLKILTELQRNARISFSELGRLVHLSAPAVRERVSRLEESGTITGYHARVQPQKLGYPIEAFLRLSVPAESYPRVLAEIGRMSEVQSCAHVTGEDAFYLRVAARSTTDLERIIACFSPYGKTATAVILSNPVQKDGLDLMALTNL